MPSENNNNNTHHSTNEIHTSVQQSDNRVKHSNTLPDPRINNTNTESEAIQPPVTSHNSNTTTITMDTGTGIVPTRSNHKFGMTLTSIIEYKNNLLMTLLDTPQGQAAPSLQITLKSIGAAPFLTLSFFRVPHQFSGQPLGFDLASSTPHDSPNIHACNPHHHKKTKASTQTPEAPSPK